MNTAKIYKDSDGNECSIHQMVKREPEWAASRIQEGEKAILLAQTQRQEDIIGRIDARMGEGWTGELADAFDKISPL